MKTEYQLIVKTNSYAGNFEREICAFMTGQIGECGVGEELVNPNVKHIFSNIIEQKQDDNGTYRPVALDPTNPDNCVIFFNSPINSDEFKLLEDGAKLFEQTRPYEYLDEDFKFLGLSFESMSIDRTIHVLYQTKEG